jgi:prepilin-type N-terminal cleavage/methylation domain-containing protein
MKTKQNSHRMRGLTMVEVIIVVVIVVVLAAVLFPALNAPKSKSRRIGCVNNLKQVSLIFRIFANDEFPWAVSTNKGGSREWVGTKEIFRHFQNASNELASPKILVCPSDIIRAPAPSFNALANTNLSYFINLAVTNDGQASDLFIGDRGLTINGSELTSGNYWIPTQKVLQWGPRSHTGHGNIGLSDGSVQQATSANLQKAILNGSLATNYLAIP